MVNERFVVNQHTFFAGLLLFLLVVLLAGCSRPDKTENVTVGVKLKSSSGEMVFLDKVTVDGTIRIDSNTTDRNGEVAFRLYTDDFDFLMVSDGVGQNILLLADKEQDIMVYTTAGAFGEDYTVTGSGGSALLQKLEKENQRTANTLDSLGQVWLKVRYQEDNIRQKEILDSVADQHLESHREWLRGFISRYPESPATIVAAYQTIRHSVPLLTYRDDPDIFHGISDRLSAIFPENTHVVDFVERHNQYLQSTALFEERERRLQPGVPAPSIALFNRHGERVTLDSLEGKLVLIHFWDGRKQQSWKNHQVLKELYVQYRHRGFEIMGIYYGDDKQLFYDIIAGDNLPWIHLFGNSTVIENYNVGKEPVMYLINRAGEMLEPRITLEALTQKLPFFLPGSGREATVSANGSENTIQ